MKIASITQAKNNLSLRVADALQLAAAFVAAEHRPASLRVVTLDERLAAAMRKEGFALIGIPAG